jgi:hypothetical protein
LRTRHRQARRGWINDSLAGSLINSVEIAGRMFQDWWGVKEEGHP